MLNLPSDSQALFVTRVWDPHAPGGAGPVIGLISDGKVIDLTSAETATMRDLLELDDPVAYVRGQTASGRVVGAVADIAAASLDGAASATGLRFLAPNDLQAVKACGVTFARSMIERVIEEKARGDAAQAAEIRRMCLDIIGERLDRLQPGSDQARAVKETLIAKGMWSPYLEVGIGPDAEVFTKSQPLSSVGWGARIGLNPASSWNNPEPEVVLAVDSRGRIKGASLGNDVNLRDIEGRSSLLLGKAKDNNASCAIGPAIRLFDDTYGLDQVRTEEVALRVEGPEGYVLSGHSSMREISRDPTDLARQVLNDNHQYPDGFMLFLGTLFAPVEDRDEPGQGFTHKVGDKVIISSPTLGELVNEVHLSADCPPWTFGAAALFRNLAQRNLF